MKAVFMGIWALLAILSLLDFGKLTAYAETRITRSFPNHEPQLDPKKRPFCNAFTGCGRKRSEMPPEPPADEANNSDEDENLSSLLDLSAEPAVENLSRQIMSEAKLWEAIQEASRELLRRKMVNDERGNNLVGTLIGPGGKCSSNSCFI